MAGTMLQSGHASMLPAITCSSCGASVDLMTLGDHVCDPSLLATAAGAGEGATPATAQEAPTSPQSMQTPLPSQPHVNPETVPSQQTSPTKSMSELAFHRPTINIPPTPAQPQTRNYDPSPMSPTSGGFGLQSPRRSPPRDPLRLDAHPQGQMPLRTNSRSHPRQVSDDIKISQDSAFPVFPSSRKKTPPAAQPQQQPPRLPRLPPQPLNLATAQSDQSFAPRSPQPMIGANVLSRMGSIAPGPFDARHKKTPSKDNGDKPFGIFRRKSTKKLSRDETSLRASISAPVPILPATLTIPQASAGFQQEPIGKEAPKLQPPALPPPPRPLRPAGIDGFVDQLKNTVKPTPGQATFEQPQSSARPQSPPEKQTLARLPSPEQYSSSSSPELSQQGDTFRMSQSTTSEDTVPSEVPSRTWSGNSWASNPRSPMFSPFQNGGLPQINEVEDTPVDHDKKPPPPAWSSGRSLAPQPPSQAPSDRAPLPSLNTSTDYFTGANKRHTPSESMSSNGSKSIWDDQTSSSRSSPPTSTTSTGPYPKPSFEESTENDGSSPTSAGLPRTAANFSRPRAPTINTIEQDSQATVPPPPVVIQNLPAISENDLPTLSPTKYERPARSPKNLSQISSISGLSNVAVVSPATPSTTSPPVVSPANSEPPRPLSRPGSSASNNPHGPRCKGNCRGCSKPIFGKSIKAADGSLTGRYHKECFGCKTCGQAFPTMDFYIKDDSPYCAYHYHYLNKSLCGSCDKGIEGHFVFNDTTKFHLECFTCSTCKQALSRDYFEIDGKRYCERDARQVHQKNQFLAPGRRFPERRTTKLMQS